MNLGSMWHFFDLDMLRGFPHGATPTRMIHTRQYLRYSRCIRPSRIQSLLAMLFWFAFAPAIAVGGTAAQVWPFPPPPGVSIELAPVEEQLLVDAASGRLNGRTLWRAALVASGVHDPSALGRYERRLEDWALELRAKMASESGHRKRGQAVFEFLHARVLTGRYQVNCTNVRHTLATGNYNCVSSAILFNCLAERVGLRTLAGELPGHAFSWLIADGERLAIETTCPTWFNIMDRPGSRQQVVAATSGHAAGQLPLTRDLSPAAVVALVYYNQGVEWLGEGRYPDAIGANLKALRLDSSAETARSNLLAAVNNWALDLADRREFAHAASLVRHGQQMDPSHRTYYVNEGAILQRWADQLVSEGRFSDAVQMLSTLARQQAHDPDFDRRRFEAYRRWGHSLGSEGRFDEALELFAVVREAHPGRLEAQATEADMIADLAVDLMERGRYDEALVWLDRGLVLHPKDPSLTANRRAAAMRWAEQSFSVGDFSEAIRRTTWHCRPEELSDAMRNNLRYGYQQWGERLRREGRLAEAEAVESQAAQDPFLH